MKERERENLENLIFISLSIDSVKNREQMPAMFGRFVICVSSGILRTFTHFLSHLAHNVNWNFVTINYLN